MSKDTPEIAAARIEAERARAKLMGTAQELQERLSPRTLARDAWEGAKHKGADVVEDAVDAVRKRPVAAGGAVAALALFLAREPLLDLAGKVVDGVTAKRSARKARKIAKKKPRTKASDKDTEDSE